MASVVIAPTIDTLNTSDPSNSFWTFSFISGAIFGKKSPSSFVCFSCCFPSIMSLKFRQAFRSTLLGCCCFWSTDRRVRRRPVRDPFVLKFSPHGRRAGAFPTHCTVVDSSGSGNSNNNKKTDGTAGAAAAVSGADSSSDGSGSRGGRASNRASVDGSCHSSAACRVDQKGSIPGNGSVHSDQSSPVLCCSVESRPLMEMTSRNGHHDNVSHCCGSAVAETSEREL